VELKVFIPSLGKSATITRKVSAPRKPKIVPASADIKAVLDEIADHPEITLSRREILRFILVEPAKRSDEIQTILKLEEIGQTRGALNTAQNKLQSNYKIATGQVQANRDTLQRHLQIAAFQSAELLAAVNARRAALGLTPIDKLTADTKLDAGLSETGKMPEFNKPSVLRDLKALTDELGTLPDLGKEEAASILSSMARLESDLALLDALQRRTLIEKGLDLVDGPDCPLCDRPWEDEEHLRDHLKAKLAKSEEAGKLQGALLKSGSDLARHIVRLLGLLGQPLKIATGEGDADCAKVITAWTTDLEKLKGRLTTMDGLMGLKDRITTGWSAMPKTLPAALATLTGKIEAKPDQSATIEAQTFLTTAQLRLNDYREAMRKNEGARIASASAQAAYDAYCHAMEDELNALYEAVQDDFSEFYKTINEGDEIKFTAKLTPISTRNQS